MVTSKKRASRKRGKAEDPRRLRLALAQLPERMRKAALLFRRLTGLSAVTSLRAAVDDGGEPGAITPPVHPRCVSELKRTKLDAPCEEQWQWHLQQGFRTHDVQSHVCPLGLRCSCVPIFYGETLVGTAKVVAGPATRDRRFALATQALELVVSRVCQDFHVSALTEELEDLRQQTAEFRKMRGRERAEPRPDRPPSETRDGSLMDQALGYLGAHYLDPALSLAEVSRALGVNGKYLTRVFTRVVGQRMHAYILELRVQHACRLLLATDRPVKAIAVQSGFRQAEGFRRVFHEHVGVPPATYRRIFTAA